MTLALVPMSDPFCRLVFVLVLAMLLLVVAIVMPVHSPRPLLHESVGTVGVVQVELLSVEQASDA